jgi:integrase
LPRLPIGELSHTPKGYRISCGYYIKEGRKLPKVFWLGHSKQQALAKAHAIRLAHASMRQRSPGRDIVCEGVRIMEIVDGEAEAVPHDGVWTPEALALIDQLQPENLAGQLVQHAFAHAAEMHQMLTPFTPASQPVDEPVAPPAAAAPRPGMTLYAAIDSYCDAVRRKNRAENHKRRTEQVLKVALKRMRRDCPLAEVNYVWIDSLCDHLKGRPKTRKGKPISPQSVKTTLAYIRAFLVWLDDSGQWEAPRKLMKPFRVRLEDLMTPAELRQQHRQIEQLDLETIKKLYHAANDFQRMLILTALFTGATQTELSVLEKSEFDLSRATLHHYRNKTRVEGRYWLPPELITLLRQHFKNHRAKRLAFYTRQKRPLVHKGGSVDAIGQFWPDLRRRAEVPNALSFRFLRKFLADYMVKNGNESIGQVALAHSSRTILGRHYSSHRDFETFHRLQQKMHAEMVAAGIFAVPRAQRKRRRPAASVSGPSNPARD